MMREYVIDHGELSMPGPSKVESLTKEDIKRRVEINDTTIIFMEAQLESLKIENFRLRGLLEHSEPSGDYIQIPLPVRLYNNGD